MKKEIRRELIESAKDFMYYGYGMAPGYYGYGCNTGCNTQQTGGRGYGYALILVLFILLIIILGAYI